jgi:hypothetical protein
MCRRCFVGSSSDADRCQAIVWLAQQSMRYTRP